MPSNLQKLSALRKGRSAKSRSQSDLDYSRGRRLVDGVYAIDGRGTKGPDRGKLKTIVLSCSPDVGRRGADLRISSLRIDLWVAILKDAALREKIAGEIVRLLSEQSDNDKRK